MTGLVKRCETDDLVERERDPVDGRAFNVHLTSRGRELRAVADDVLRELDGLVERERDPVDGRAFNVRLTSRGQAFRAVADDVLRELDAELLQALGTRNHDALVRALKGVIEL